MWGLCIFPTFLSFRKMFSAPWWSKLRSLIKNIVVCWQFQNRGSFQHHLLVARRPGASFRDLSVSRQQNDILLRQHLLTWFFTFSEWVINSVKLIKIHKKHLVWLNHAEEAYFVHFHFWTSNLWILFSHSLFFLFRLLPFSPCLEQSELSWV